MVRLTGNWQPYTLPPEAFQFWVDPPVPGRGHRGDTFRPENAETLTFGLAHSHTDLISSRGHYWIWLDQVGTVAPPAELKDSSAIFASTPAMPVIETVSPPYKLYPVTNLQSAGQPRPVDRRATAVAENGRNTRPAVRVPWAPASIGTGDRGSCRLSSAWTSRTIGPGLPVRCSSKGASRPTGELWPLCR